MDVTDLELALDYIDAHYDRQRKAEKKREIKEAFKKLDLKANESEHWEKTATELIEKTVRLETIIRTLEAEKRQQNWLIPPALPTPPPVPYYPPGVRVFNSQNTGDIRSGIDDPWLDDTPEK